MLFYSGSLDMKKTDLIEVISKQSKISRLETKLCVKVILAELTSAIAPDEDTLQQVVNLLKEKRQDQVWDLAGELLVGHLQDHIRKLPEEKQVLDQEEETSDDSVDIL